MSVPTLLELIEEYEAKKLVCRIIIGGAILPKWSSLSYSFAIGQVPTATITVPSRSVLPNAVSEEASVEIWLGFSKGAISLDQMVFGGAVVDSVSNNANEVIIECVMSGPRKLTYGYNRRINYDFTAVAAETAVIDLMQLAGVANYYVDLAPWIIGTAVPQEIQFSSYGEAINKIAEVDGSPWYALPTGQVRVELRDPLPSPTARRVYFSGILTGPLSTNPTAITNSDAKPRIADIQRRKFRSEVANFIEVDGAVVVSFGPNGEQNSNQIVEQVDGASGQFPNGAPWIPTPPLFQDFTLSNELIDTNAKAFEVGERYFDLKNRLIEKTPLTVPADPDIFLGETVQIVDPNYTGVNSFYFVEAYTTTIDDNSALTEMSLVGGPEAGTTGFASPFAEFHWKYTALHQIIGGGWENWDDLDLGPGADEAAKLCEDVPEGTGSEEQGGNFIAGEDKRTVIIGLDGTASQDFDGFIVDWEWTYLDALDQPRTLHGPRITLVFDPDVTSSVEMTLTVTDNSGRTSSITKTIYTSADYLQIPGESDSTTNDTDNGGGVAAGPCTGDSIDEDTPPPHDDGTAASGGCNGMGLGYYIAAGAYAMGTVDNRTWNDLLPADVGAVGQFISVASSINFRTRRSIGIFGTDTGEVVVTDDVCETGITTFRIPGSPRIECILIDKTQMGTPNQGEETGNETDGEGLRVYTQANPGTLTVKEAYEQALAVGFSTTSAVIAVAIMIGESGLVSNASNTTGNIPPSTDRGIAQINSYYHPEVTDACAYNTACAIRAMFAISSGGTDFTPWVIYTGGHYRQHLSRVQEELGIDGPVGDQDDGGGYTDIIPDSFKVWLGTSDGRIYTSDTSGRDWTLLKQFTDGFPIYAIITDSRISTPSPEVPALAVFGGNTSHPETLMRVLVNNFGLFSPIPLSQEFKAAVEEAGPGFTIRTAVLGTSALLVGFDGGLINEVWLSPDPIGDPESWAPATDDTFPDAYDFGFNGGVFAGAHGFNGEFLLAGPSGTTKTIDNENFSLNNSVRTDINHIVWEGLAGVYLASADSGFIKTIDYAAGWGYLRPNTEFGTLWPVGAIGYQAAFAIGPRDGGACGGQFDCSTFGYTVAAWNSVGAATDDFNGYEIDVEENNGPGVMTIADAFRSANGTASLRLLLSGSHAAVNSATSASLNFFAGNDVPVTIIIAVASRQDPETLEFPIAPTITSAELTDVEELETIQFGTSSRLTIFRATGSGVASAFTVTFDFLGQEQQAISYIIRELVASDPNEDNVLVSTSSEGVDGTNPDTDEIPIELGEGFVDYDHTWIVQDV